jgi:hypothetical protein
MVNEASTNLSVPVSRPFHSRFTFLLPQIATCLAGGYIFYISEIVGYVTFAGRASRKCAEMIVTHKSRLGGLYAPRNESGDNNKYLSELNHGYFGMVRVESCRNYIPEIDSEPQLILARKKTVFRNRHKLE